MQAVNPGVGTTTFKYDPFGRRNQKSGPLGTTNYLYDGSNLLEAVDNSGILLTRYTDTLNVDEPLAEFASGTTSYYGQDGQASVTSLSNSAGTLTSTYTYDSFGKLTASSGTTGNAFRYTGREFDPETGIYEYRARYFDSNSGRFTSEDPIRFRAGIDFYQYVSNNPGTFKDAFGLEQECTLVAEHQLTPWIPTANIISTTPWVYKDFSEIDEKGIAVIRCRWERTVTEDLWGHALFALEYRCTVKLPCGLALEYSSYGFDVRKRYEGRRENADWIGTSYTMFPMDDGDLFYESLCKGGAANPNNWGW